MNAITIEAVKVPVVRAYYSSNSFNLIYFLVKGNSDINQQKENYTVTAAILA